MDPVSTVGTDTGFVVLEGIKLLVPIATLLIGLVGGYFVARKQSADDWKRQRNAEVDREQRDWERRIVKEVCAPAMANTMAARKDFQELEAFVTAFRRNILPGTSKEIRLRSYELTRRTLDHHVQMDRYITGVAMAIDVPTGSVLLDAFKRLARGSVPGNLPQMLDGSHDPQLESLLKELPEKIS